MRPSCAMIAAATCVAGLVSSAMRPSLSLRATQHTGWGCNWGRGRFAPFVSVQLGTGSFCTIQLKTGSFRAICEGGGVTWGASFLPGQIVATHARASTRSGSGPQAQASRLSPSRGRPRTQRAGGARSPRARASPRARPRASLPRAQGPGRRGRQRRRCGSACPPARQVRER